MLALKEICYIGDTADSGITLLQLRKFDLFISRMAGSWYETFGVRAGQQLDFEDFNLYNADYWLIRPATAGYRGGTGCSLAEIMAESVAAQAPQWFVSHPGWSPFASFGRVWSNMLSCGNCWAAWPTGCVLMPTTSTMSGKTSQATRVAAA